MRPTTVPVGSARHVRRRGALLGLLGAVLVLAGGSWYQAWATPPYRYIDEQAHVGYVLSLQRGQLPTIDTPIDSGRGGDALRERLATEPARRQDVWVANNPPLAYVVALPTSTATRAFGITGGPLLGLRLANVAATAAAVALSYRLGRNLSRSDRAVGVTTAALVALLPHVGFIAALGFNDGIALLATTGVLHALVALLNSTREIDANGRGAHHIRRGWGWWFGFGVGDGVGRRTLVLGLWCAAAAAVRPMGLAFAVAAGVIAVIGTWGRASLVPTLVRLGAPTVVLAGWWYVGNVVRYGDPTGSDALFEKFVREPSGSIASKLRDNTIWESAFRTIATRRTDAPLASDPLVWFRVAEVLAVAGVAATVALVVIGRRRDRPVVAAAVPQLSARAWAGAGALALVPVVLTAQHAAGGGNPHPRYLLPAVPVLAAAVATALVRIAGRGATAVVLLGLAVLTAVQTRASIADLVDHPIAAPGSPLAAPAGPPWVQALGVAAAFVGLVLVLGSVLGLVPPNRPTTAAGDPEPQDPGGA